LKVPLAAAEGVLMMSMMLDESGQWAGDSEQWTGIRKQEAGSKE
jgi:hypothetical protein